MANVKVKVNDQGGIMSQVSMPSDGHWTCRINIREKNNSNRPATSRNFEFFQKHQSQLLPGQWTALDRRSMESGLAWLSSPKGCALDRISDRWAGVCIYLYVDYNHKNMIRIAAVWTRFEFISFAKKWTAIQTRILKDTWRQFMYRLLEH